MKLTILYQDSDFVAVFKPPGLLVHRTNIDAENKLFALQILRNQIGQRVYPVHRLDKPTSGVLLFALNLEACQAANHLFFNQMVQKEYLAIVRGIPDQERFNIDHPLKIEGKSRESETEVQLLKSIKLNVKVDKYPQTWYSLLKLVPKTGRRHQIRRHLKHIHHPIVGDTSYGKSRHNHFFAERFSIDRLYLFCQKICFSHKGIKKTFSSAIDKDFQTVLTDFNWQLADELQKKSFVRSPEV